MSFLLATLVRRRRGGGRVGLHEAQSHDYAEADLSQSSCISQFGGKRKREFIIWLLCPRNTEPQSELGCCRDLVTPEHLSTTIMVV